MCNSPVFAANPVRGRLNALFFRVFDGYINRLLNDQKSRLFAELPDSVVELGAGVGANFRYFRPGTSVTAVEPNPHMHSRLRQNAADHRIDLEIVASLAEALDLPDNSATTVICTLVLCTVDRPERVLDEVRRVLRPGGRFVFIEHIAAPAGTWLRRLQNVLHRPWRYLFEGCNTNRETGHLIETAGFRRIDVERYNVSGLFIPVRTQIAGIAVV